MRLIYFVCGKCHFWHQSEKMCVCIACLRICIMCHWWLSRASASAATWLRLPVGRWRKSKKQTKHTKIIMKKYINLLHITRVFENVRIWLTENLLWYSIMTSIRYLLSGWWSLTPHSAHTISSAALGAQNSWMCACVFIVFITRIILHLPFKYTSKKLRKKISHRKISLQRTTANFVYLFSPLSLSLPVSLACSRSVSGLSTCETNWSAGTQQCASNAYHLRENRRINYLWNYHMNARATRCTRIDEEKIILENEDRQLIVFLFSFRFFSCLLFFVVPKCRNWVFQYLYIIAVHI